MRPAVHQATVLYDGGCGFCGRSVARVADRLPDHVRLVPYQDAPDVVSSAGLGDTPQRTLVWLSAGRAHVRSSAVVRLWWAAGGRWRLAAAALWIVPKPLRDLAYVVVAANRHRL